ncbi:hypothetical protein DFH08DRAFT_825824 [Mycena albidolilacea]|uniref:Uncharacterized protein n=1 Tax=Mycena albidolilacea TaxID=1033008 RepID=A0AAD6Z184_9AGAR|nr:hypothetical protein DFH08DRAFT_825824 [Mycena albidolilacea]
MSRYTPFYSPPNLLQPSSGCKSWGTRCSRSEWLDGSSKTRDPVVTLRKGSNSEGDGQASDVHVIVLQCDFLTKLPRYSPPDMQIVYTLAVHREKPHLSVLLTYGACAPRTTVCYGTSAATLLLEVDGGLPYCGGSQH